MPIHVSYLMILLVKLSFILLLYVIVSKILCVQYTCVDIDSPVEEILDSVLTESLVLLHRYVNVGFILFTLRTKVVVSNRISIPA